MPFLSKYFPRGRTAKLRADTTSFTQLHGESLYEAWERFKDLHGISDWLLIQTFCNGLEQNLKMPLDAAAGGAVMGKSINSTKALLEDMNANDCRWSSERTTSKRDNGKYDVDVANMLASKVDALAQRFNKLWTSNAGMSSGIMYEVSVICDACGIQGHKAAECLTYFHGMEQANVMQNFYPRPKNNPYSNTYNPGWRNHLNFSYTDSNPVPRTANQPPGF